MIFLESCHYHQAELTYFKNMTQYPRFDSVKNKSKLFGFDRIAIMPTGVKINNTQCWYLSSSKDAIFNIQGFIWKEDSIIYIKTINKEGSAFFTAKKQVLFNFGNTKSSWTIDNSRADVPADFTISRMASFYNKAELDTIINFHIEKYGKFVKSSPLVSFTLQVSLRHGFTGVGYSRRSEKSVYFILLQPKQRLEIVKDDSPIAPLE